MGLALSGEVAARGQKRLDHSGAVDADTTDVEVFTETGAWVGTVPEPNGLGELLEAFEQRQAAGGE